MYDEQKYMEEVAQAEEWQARSGRLIPPVATSSPAQTKMTSTILYK